MPCLTRRLHPVSGSGAYGVRTLEVWGGAGRPTQLSPVRLCPPLFAVTSLGAADHVPLPSSGVISSSRGRYGGLSSDDLATTGSGVASARAQVPPHVASQQRSRGTLAVPTGAVGSDVYVSMDLSEGGADGGSAPLYDENASLAVSWIAWRRWQ